ncbi:hypothetical protein [uncultured Ruegeria sp.]|uniref:hypothetical protein n=1 Tax=uncultured Ruegeria sp. TaxID=259304 RepID=UPI002623E475|nr:hypothetical protein [uncultured Ruegeria sp.]
MANATETARTTVRLPVGVKRWLEVKSCEKGISANTFVSLTLQEKMEEDVETQK